MTRRIALATAAHLPSLYADDLLLPPAFARRGALAEATVWTAPRDWAAYDAVVLRSCWDYDARLAEFRTWLDLLDRAGVPVHNATAVIRQNVHKRYLVGLGTRGVTVPAGQVLPRGSATTLADVTTAGGWSAVVVKPAVGMSGRSTWRVGRADTAAREADFAALLAAGDVLVQEYVPEIRTLGETSFVFLNGLFSHAVVKRPAPDEFRVQDEHGGRWEPARPDAVAVEQAQAALTAAGGEGTTYARVDAVPRPDRFIVMEVELIDPQCYLRADPSAADRFVSAVLRNL